MWQRQFARIQNFIERLQSTCLQTTRFSKNQVRAVLFQVRNNRILCPLSFQKHAGNLILTAFDQEAKDKKKKEDREKREGEKKKKRPSSGTRDVVSLS